MLADKKNLPDVLVALLIQGLITEFGPKRQTYTIF
jgi:hypothetical protein